LPWVNGWVEREHRSVTQEAEALAYRQETKRTILIESVDLL
jgi:hypothetical protein